MFLADSWTDYEVLDTGDGEKLERWGDIILRRPDPQTIWPKAQEKLWKSAQAHYHRSERGGGEWEFLKKLPERWTVKHGDLNFYVRPTGFKHTGLFPEQAANWIWMSNLIRKDGRKDIKVLNLFGYTGGATLACAAAGARFVQRELRRGNSYDGILMDPPSYGRGPSGEVWKLENELYGLIETCAQALSKEPLFFLINSYTTGFQASVLSNMLEKCVVSRFGGKVDSEELCLPVTAGGVLPCGASGRWQRD